MFKLPSVIVNDLNVPGIALIETKAQAPLVIDAYAELTRTVALEEFEPIVRGHPQVFKSSGTVEHLQLALGHGPEMHPAHHTLAAKKLGCVFAPKRLDHGARVFNAAR
jgi:hypothetical protein